MQGVQSDEGESHNCKMYFSVIHCHVIMTEEPRYARLTREKAYPKSRNPAGRPKGLIYRTQRHMIDGTQGPGKPPGVSGNKRGISAQQREENALIAMADYASKGTLKSGKQLLLEFANDESI